MIMSCHRTTIAIFLLVTLLAAPAGAAAQQAAQSDQQTQPPATPPPDTGQKVAAAEEQTKPTRRFFSALFHNLADDMKHIPRKNSLYWLGGGGALALLVHQRDEKINNSLSNSEGAKTFFTAGKYAGSFPVLMGVSVTTYIVGRTRPSKRARHLGMDLIEATLLADGMTELIKVAARRQRPLR